MTCLPTLRRHAAAALLLAPVLAVAGVSVRLDPASTTTTPFPSDRFSVRDWSQLTFRRVSLPKPDCAVKPVECGDIDVLNGLDGFSTQPRITVPFTGPIDVASVSSDTVFLLNLGDTLSLRGFGERVGINQIEFDPATNTLIAQPEQLLNEHSRYVLIVTSGLRAADGRGIEGGAFDRSEPGDRAHRDDEYERDMRNGARFGHRGRDRIVAASLFTTQSISADLVKVMRQLKASQPGPVDFNLGRDANGAAVRSVFNLADLQSITITRQTGAAPAFAPPAPLPTAALQVVPGAVGRIAYGKFSSPNYLDAGQAIPATPTIWGRPAPQGRSDLLLQLFVPSGPKPAGGWPVAIFGHGFTDSMYGVPWTVASVFASKGIATLSINVVGHGFGPLGTLQVQPVAGAPITLPAGGRGFDQDGNGTIDSTEGVNAAPPRTVIGSRDGLRQTTIDLMQLVRQVQAGIDIDGDGRGNGKTLDGNRIYYAGQSFGGIYGTILLGVEPDIKAGVPNVPGGSITEIARLSPAFRTLTAISLAQRNLLNLPPVPNLPVPFNFAFDENIPLRNLPPVVNTVPGALAIQQSLDRFQWAQQSGNPVSYAPYIRKHPLPGVGAKPVLIQFAKGDQTVPNPTSSAIVRAGDLADRTTLNRHDLAYAADPTLPKNPHTFLSNIASPGAAPYAIGAQTQMAVFFASGGATVIDPDGAGPIFETPIAGPLPETLSFIP